MARKMVLSQLVLYNYILSHKNKIRKEWKEEEWGEGLACLLILRGKGMPLYPKLLRKHQASQEVEQKGGVVHILMMSMQKQQIRAS